MRASTSLVAVLAAIAVCFGQGISEPRLSAEQRPESNATRRESRVIDALNNCIQARFRDIDDRFGVRRIVKIGETPHRFEPESVVEMSSVRALEQARLEVILYVAGTRVMRPAPALSLIGDANARAIIKGPVRVTSGATSTDGAAALRPMGGRPARDARIRDQRIARVHAVRLDLRGSSSPSVRAGVSAVPQRRWPKALDPGEDWRLAGSRYVRVSPGVVASCA